ncbi:MAG: hypothetical protein MUE81_11660 [Thermoflexibacter sp.]|nr:hypothetical protein [Thermoflexibacter sp.]
MELQKAQSSHPLVIAFHACLETLKAKSLWNPLEKLSMAKQSQQTFSKAILLNPDHLEIRFLRYSIQLSLPAYLYLSTNLEEDKQMIIKAIQNNPHDIEPENLQIIVSFLLKDGQLSASEKESILNAMNRF